MKIKQILSLLLILAFSVSAAKADEGMWLLNMIGKNYKQMKAQGFRLKPEDVYSVNKSSLKDAICVFGGYCTAEIVSSQGLLFTNHHCGYTAIQQHSSLENDYIKDGFWAKTMADEIPTPGLYVNILQNIADVTGDVLDGVNKSMSEEKRQEIIHKNIENITARFRTQYPEDESYVIEIKPFFEGNAYYMMAYLRYNDVRMVGTPPDAIGKFGGDTDNWMWPRHTCDFSVFRIYADINGKPAEYSPSNTPFVPKHHLRINMNGYKEGDFAMVMGFPGITQRYSTSYEIENDMLTNGYRAKIRGIRQDVLHADMEASQEILIKYATKFAHSSNYWKNSIEANKSLKALNIVSVKQEQERNFEAWYSNNPALKNEYKRALPKIQEVCASSRDNAKNMLYINECLLQGMELIIHAYTIFSFVSNPDGQTKDEFINKCHTFYKDYSKETDRKASLEMAKLYLADIDEMYHPSFLKGVDVDSAINLMFSSPLTTKEGFDEFAQAPDLQTLRNDPMIKAMASVFQVYFAVQPSAKADKEALSAARRSYTKGVNEMNAKKNLYPDANFTERLTYGRVLSYKDPAWNPQNPAPDVDGRSGDTFSFFTTSDGVLQKEKPGDYEFDVPEKLHTLLANKDFGRYADKDGSLHTCFLTDNDITGGNSGSPVLDAYGNLIGLAFDGNSEAMCSDWIFRNDVQRCINVDIRYVLFIIDKYAGCQRIIDELTFAAPRKK
ncbi:MAG: S46 family peptidase [Bacteroidales bacterium]|nr:S46 family peptidase [Bacteroidales bacterium]